MFHNQRTVVVKTSNKWKLTIHHKVPLSGNYNYQAIHMFKTDISSVIGIFYELALFLDTQMLTVCMSHLIIMILYYILDVIFVAL
jgi:hypothetical protein